MLPMACYEGSFQFWNKSIRILSESVTRAVDTAGVGRGAIASISPTGFGLVSGHDLLEIGLFQAVFHDGADTLGAAFTAAKAHLLANDPYGSYKDLMDTFLLIGDPALRLKVGAACETPTGIGLTGFQAKAQGRSVRLTWQTNSETDILGFNVLRAELTGDGSQAPGFVTINPALIFAQASGNGNGGSYTYDDERVGRARLFLRIGDRQAQWQSVDRISDGCNNVVIVELLADRRLFPPVGPGCKSVISVFRTAGFRLSATSTRICDFARLALHNY